MGRPSPPDLTQLIDSPSGDIKSLMDQLAKIQTLNNTLDRKLNATLAKHCRVANVRKSTLVIAVDSAAWANKLRFQLPELLSFLRSEGFLGLANIEVIVQPR